MKVRITKFKTVENLDVQIPSQISGGNGFGKSTILEAISFVLTGKNLDGKEFEQVYDNRVDIHDAIADVSFFDNYGNEFQRVVKPIFQTNRAGIEEIKIKRSTECRKNGIVVNDFSDEFQDFYKFGTDYLFNQKEDVQRSIFIDILKSKLPDYDVNANSLKLKELKKSQKIEVDAVKSLNDANKNTKDVPVSEITIGLAKAHSDYIALSTSQNPEAVAEINKRNNDLMMSHFNKKMNIQNDITRCNLTIERNKSEIETLKSKLQTVENANFEPKQLHYIESLSKICADLEKQFSGLEYFESMEAYAQKYFSKNPVLVENQAKIKSLMSTKFIFVDDNNSSGCPLSGKFCETAKEHSEKSQMIKFDANINIQIEALKSQNRQILQKERTEINSKYLSVKSELERETSLLNKLIDANKQIEKDNEFLKESFEIENKKAIQELQTKIDALYDGQLSAEKLLKEKQSELSSLIEPTPEKLPESVEISEELIELNNKYIALSEEIIGAKAINENNARLITERNAEIKVKQANLFKIGEQISILTDGISDYFNNLKGIVKTEFGGDIEIDVELLEYVMSRDEYKDCFKLTANGKVFPYECNGALQNNVKIQILANLQRLKDYKGITVMDNCEANTTQPINTLGLNCVLAYATLENELTIK